jgi:voltage-gated potassium channel
VEGHANQRAGARGLRFGHTALAADARRPQSLLLAGITHPQCRGVVALTDDDHANLAVAMTTRLLSPSLPVLARVHSPEIAQNLASIGTQHVIDPFEKFGEYLVLAMRAPGSIASSTG